MNVALLMGRGGSKSIIKKNVYPVLGRPLVSYPMTAALKAKKIDRVMVSTDCPDIMGVAKEMGVEIIERPPELSRDDSEQADGISHALSVIGPDVEYLVEMHCNCATHYPGLIDDCITELENHPEADSCVSTVTNKAVHPFRTRRRTPDNYLEPWMDIPENTSSNRQSLEPCVELDGAARAMRVSSCFPINGIQPFPYLGKKVRTVENEGGFDIHDEDDFILAEQYLRRHGWTEASES